MRDSFDNGTSATLMVNSLVRITSGFGSAVLELMAPEDEQAIVVRFDATITNAKIRAETTFSLMFDLVVQFIISQLPRWRTKFPKQASRDERRVHREHAEGFKNASFKGLPCTQ